MSSWTGWRRVKSLKCDGDEEDCGDELDAIVSEMATATAAAVDVTELLCVTVTWRWTSVVVVVVISSG